MKIKRVLNLQKRDILLVLIPAIAWFGLIENRKNLIDIPCKTEPQQCSYESIPAFDRFSVNWEDMVANKHSFTTQNISAAVGIAGPIVFYVSQVALRTASLPVAASMAATDLVIMSQAVLWNGAFNEAFKIFTGRPRPFVYKDPTYLGANPSHYTSFYSGHTSFTAAILGVMLIMLILRGLSKRIWIPISIVSSILVGSTGWLRIMAGRHFLSDVIVGALAGFLVAVVVVKFHHRKSKTS